MLAHLTAGSNGSVLITGASWCSRGRRRGQGDRGPARCSASSSPAWPWPPWPPSSGQAIEQVGERLGPGATGLLQSTLGNLPELFVGLFALREGLTGVVRAALVGSVLGNALLVLGLRLRGRRAAPRHPALRPRGAPAERHLLLLAVGALLVPTLAVRLGTPAALHAGALSDACAVVLLVVYAGQHPVLATTVRSAHRTDAPRPRPRSAARSGDRAARAVAAAAGHLPAGRRQPAASAAGVGLVRRRPGAGHQALGLSQTFTGLVVVAIASNAVENAVGIRFALKAKPDYAISTTLNSPLQVALLLTPVLVLLSRVVGPDQLTLVFPPLLVAALAVAAVVVVGRHLRRRVHLDRGRRPDRPVRDHRRRVLVGVRAARQARPSDSAS